VYKLHGHPHHGRHHHGYQQVYGYKPYKHKKHGW
jgi:hypothetical protein